MKYRVICPDGSTVIIEASNMENARTIARSRYGQLPNEINLNIVSDIMSDLNSLIGELHNELEKLGNNSREYDWEAVHKQAKDIVDRLISSEDRVGILSGSLVKVKENSGE